MNVVYFKIEGRSLFNDALDTFYLRLYDVRYLAEDHWCRHFMDYSFRFAAR